MNWRVARNYLLLLLLLAGALAVSLNGGFAPTDNPLPTAQWHRILWQIRWPRALMALLIGAGLGVAGTTLQALFRNPLAEPSVLGISSGATAFALCTLVLIPGFYAGLETLIGAFTLPLLAATGALLTLALLLFLSRHQAWDPGRVILLGLSLNVLASALLGFSAYWSTDQQLRILSFWSLGSLTGATLLRCLMIASILIPATALLVRQWRFLNAMLLGEAEAYHLGFQVRQRKLLCFIAVALIAGAAVAFSGIIGFVGLVVPHLMRLMFGPNHRHLLAYSLLGGAAFLLAADTLAHLVLAPLELPVGLLTALLGAPTLIFLLNRRQAWRTPH